MSACCMHSLTEEHCRTDGVQIVISEYTHRLVHQSFLTRELDSVAVKGKAKARERADPANAKHVGAPIPAMVSSIATSVGKPIKKGDKIAVLEAMKMQTTLYAQADGVVDAILVQVGDSVESKDLVARLR